MPQPDDTRDWFAGMALNALLQRPTSDDPMSAAVRGQLEAQAYDWAEKMMAEKKKRNPTVHVGAIGPKGQP